MGALQTEVGSAAAAAELVETLHERYAKAIRGYCLRRLRSPEEADDATQVVFLIAYRCLAEGMELRAAGAWLFKIAENVVLQRRRALARRARVEYAVDVDRIANAAVAPPVGEATELDGVREALANMPESQRRAIVLREWYGLSYREVANELGVSSTAIDALIFRARRGLVRRLEGRNRLTRNGRRLAVWLPAGPFRYLLGGGGIGAKVAVGVASVAFVAVATHPQVPGIVLTAAKTARVTTSVAHTRFVAQHRRHRPGGPTHRLRTVAVAAPRSSETASPLPAAPAAPPVPDAGGRNDRAAPASPPPVASQSGTPSAGADTATRAGGVDTASGAVAGATPPSPDTGVPAVGPDPTTPAPAPPETTPSGKTPPAVGRTPSAVPPGQDPAHGNAGSPGSGSDQAHGNRPDSTGNGNGDNTGNGNGQANGRADGQANGNGLWNGVGQGNGLGASTGGAPPVAPGQSRQLSGGQSGDPDEGGSPAPAAASGATTD